jgi:hypothetical protein
MSEAWLVVGFTHGVVKVVVKRINVWRGVRVTGFMFMFGVGSKQQGVVGHQLRLEHCQAAKFLCDPGAHPEAGETLRRHAYAAPLIVGGLLHATPGS